jgi:hypothetical protein
MQLNESLGVVFLQVVITLGGIIFLTIIRYIQKKKPQSNPIQCMQYYAMLLITSSVLDLLSCLSSAKRNRLFLSNLLRCPWDSNLNPGVF